MIAIQSNGMEQTCTKWLCLQHMHKVHRKIPTCDCTVANLT